MLSKKRLSILIFIVCILANVVFAAAIINASGASSFYQGQYIGYGNILQNDEVDGEGKQISEQPMITVLTAGMGGHASSWSNDLQEQDGQITGTGGFAYDSQSLIEALRNKATREVNGVDVFWANFTTVNSNQFSLISIEPKETEFALYSASGMETIEAITDPSNHIIILYDPSDAFASNADAYAEFNFMMDRLVYDYAFINGGIYPKINLIGHSRGGLINMDYAQNHPKLIDSIYSLGTPYFGSNFGKINIFANAIAGYSPAFTSIQNENEQISRAENWNDNYDDKYSHIKVFPYAGYSSLNFLEELIDAGYTQAYGDVADSIEALIKGFSYFRWPIVDLIAKNQIADEIRAAEATSGLPQTDKNTIKTVLDKALSGSMIWGVTVYDDLFVDYDSQIGMYNDLWGYRGMGEFNINPYSNTKCYEKLSDANISKVSVNNAPIVHNLQSRDPFFINKIVWNINLGAEEKLLEFEYQENYDGSVTITKMKNWTHQVNISLPSEINGKTVSKIGDDFISYYVGYSLNTISIPNTVCEIGDKAFMGYLPLQNIDIPSSITIIGDRAFQDCSNLKNIFISENITTIGQKALLGCYNLNVVVSVSNPDYTAENNILYNKTKSKIIAACKITPNISIPASVIEIVPYAFAGNVGLEKLDIKGTPVIGQYAFANCANMSKAYFNSYEVPTIGSNSFLYDNFTLYVPHSKQQVYNNEFLGYTNSIDSIGVDITFVSEGKNVGAKSTYYGAIISELIVPFKLGYDFSGWYDNVNFTGMAYSNGGLWNMTEDMTLYARFTPKKYYIIFDGTGSENLEDKEVTYDSPIGSLPTIDLEGKTFAGWKNSRNEYYTEDTIWKDLNNVTLTSDVFSASYIVTLDKQGGDEGSSRVDPIYLEAMPSATAPKRDGYTFQGYFTEPNGNGTKYYNANMSSARNWDIAQDRELFAYWIGIQSEIILNHENGVGINAQLTSISSANIIYTSFVPSYSGTITLWTSYTSGDPYLYLYNSSFSQLAYNDDAHGNRNSEITYNVTAGLTYVVGFRAYSSSTTVGRVYYSGVGLSSSSRCDRVKATYGSPLPTSGLATPQKTGYSFNGYYTQKEGYGDKYYDGPTVTSLGEWNKQSSIILYANYEKHYYNVTLNLGYTSYNDSISIGYGDVVTADGQYAQYVFNRIGYDFKGFYSGRNGTGTKYFGYEIEYLYSDYCYKLISENQRWYNSFDGEIYAYWTKISEKYRYPVVISNADDGDRYFYTDTMTHGGNITITAPTIDGYTFSKMWVNGYDREGSSYTIENIQLKRNLGYGIDGYEDSLPFYLWYPGYGYPQMNQGGLFMVYTKNECVAEGTLITLADGSQKAVETLIGNEMLLVWDLRTGTFGYAPILFIDTDSANNYKIIHAYFSDGTDVKVIGEHAFFDFNLNKYVFFRDDAAQYIGNWYNKQTTDANGNMTWTRVQLVDVQIYTEYTTSWSPVTFEYLCYYVNGMLSMPGATTGLINIFDVDGNTMQYDASLFELDIETYGLFTYEEFVEMFNVPEYIFEAFNAQYLKISIGKGLITVEQLGCLIERYAEFFKDQNVEDDCSTDEFCRHNKHHDNGSNQGNSNGRKIGHNKNYRTV